MASIETAVSALADDPSFASMPPAEQRQEARQALARIAGVDADDPDNLLAAIAQALEARAARGPTARTVDTGVKRLSVAAPAASRPVAAPATAPRSQWTPQACRRPGACVEVVAATGRCLSCGAQRQEPPPDAVLRPTAPSRKPVQKHHPIPDNGRRAVSRDFHTGEWINQRREVMSRGNSVQKAKAMLGLPDTYFAWLLGKSLPTIWAYQAGRFNASIGVPELTALWEIARQQRELLDEYIHDLEDLLGLEA